MSSIALIPITNVVSLLPPSEEHEIEEQRTAKITKIVFSCLREKEREMKKITDKYEEKMEKILADELFSFPLALSTSEKRLVTYLLQTKQIQGGTLLRLGVCWGPREIVQLALNDRDTNVNARNRQGQTALMLSIFSERFFRMLLDHPELDVNAQDSDGLTALMHACRWGQGNIEVIQGLLQRADINPNMQSFYGDTALRLAARIGGESVVPLREEESLGYHHFLLFESKEKVKMLLEHPKLHLDRQIEKAFTLPTWLQVEMETAKPSDVPIVQWVYMKELHRMFMTAYLTLRINELVPFPKDLRTLILGYAL